MDRGQLDTLVRQLHAGRIDRRAFLARAAALGLSAGAAGTLARTAAQPASPAASPGASPIASPATTGHAMTSITREEYWQAVRQAFPIEPPARQGGAVIEGGTRDIETLNPILAADFLSFVITAYMFDALVVTSPLDGFPAPGLADFWERSDDGLTYTFHLNPDATWHDGRPVTAADVVFSFEAALASDSLSPGKGTVEQYLAGVRGVDDHTVQLVAKDRYAIFIENTAALVPIVPRHLWESVAPAEWGTDPGATGQDPRRVVGSGPFTFREWVVNDHVTLLRRPDHWDPNVQPVIDEYTLRVLPEQSAAIQAFAAGEIDIVAVGPPQVESLQQSRPDAVLTTFDTLGFSYFVPMQDPERTELFLDIGVRQALMYALDRQLAAERIFLGYATPADGTQPVLSVAYRPEQITTRYGYDPERARQLLEEAGWTVGNDGIRERAGVRFSFECLFSRDIALFQQLLPYLQEAWRTVGIEMVPVAVPFPTLIDALDTGDFAMALLGFSWSVDGSQGTMYRCDAVPPSGFNYMHYCNPRYDELDTAQASELDEARRIELLVEASNLVNDEAANGILFFQRFIIGAQPRLHNFLPNGYSSSWSLPFVWIDE